LERHGVWALVLSTKGTSRSEFVVVQGRVVSFMCVGDFPMTLYVAETAMREQAERAGYRRSGGIRHMLDNNSASD